MACNAHGVPQWAHPSVLREKVRLTLRCAFAAASKESNHTLFNAERLSGEAVLLLPVSCGLPRGAPTHLDEMTTWKLELTLFLAPLKIVGDPTVNDLPADFDVIFVGIACFAHVPGNSQGSSRARSLDARSQISSILWMKACLLQYLVPRSRKMSHGDGPDLVLRPARTPSRRLPAGESALRVGANPPAGR